MFPERGCEPVAFRRTPQPGPSRSQALGLASALVRLLLVSDLHYALPHFDWVLDRSADFDLVVLAGDSLDLSSGVPLESQIVVVRTYLRKLAATTTTIASSGNHDLTGRNDHGEKSAPWLDQAEADGVVVDWATLQTDGVRITVCPWWDGSETRDDVDRQLADDASDRLDRWIWVYHSPPDAAPVSWTGRRHIGDTDLNSWIDEHRPDLVLTGHIHDSPFIEGGSWIARLGSTWVMNPGHTIGPVPAHVVIDTDTGAADWWSPYGDAGEQLWPSLEAQ